LKKLHIQLHCLISVNIRRGYPLLTINEKISTTSYNILSTHGSSTINCPNELQHFGEEDIKQHPAIELNADHFCNGNNTFC
jgi:hypothetical protein